MIQKNTGSLDREYEPPRIRTTPVRTPSVASQTGNAETSKNTTANNNEVRSSE